MRNLKATSLGCAIVWLLSNAVFGLAPLLFLAAINPALDNVKVYEEIHTLVKGGIILFVCCALMGAVVIDILLSNRIKFKKLGYFAVNVSPFILLSIICGIYLMILLGHAHPNIFTTLSKFYTFVIVFTVGYCILGKYLLYKSEQNPSFKS